MLICNVFIECKVKGISIDLLYNRDFKSDDEVDISAEDKDFDVTIATDDHNKDISFCDGLNQLFTL